MSAPTAAPPETAKPARFAALESRNFKLLWFGLLLSNIGSWMATTAEGWLVTDLRPDDATFWLGMIAAAFAIPMIGLTLFGGAIADRVPRMKLLWVLQIAFLLITITGTVLVWTGKITPVALVVLSFLTGMVLAFDAPTRHSLLPSLVTREQLTSAVSMNSVAWTTAAMIGPAIAGSLIPLVGIKGIYVINTVSCLATLTALALMSDIPAHQPSQSTENVFRSIKAGFDYIMGDRLIRTLLLIALVAGVLARSFSPMLPVFAKDEFSVGSAGFGFLVSAVGLGSMIGGFGLAARRSVNDKGRVIIVTTVIQCLLLACFAFNPWYPVAIPLLVLVGALTTIPNALTATLIQFNAPNEIRGRAMSFYLLTLIAFPSLGSLGIGILADAVGVRVAVGACAVVAAAVVGAISLRNRWLATA